MAFWNKKQIENESQILEPIFGGGSMSRVSFGSRIPARELAKRFGMMVHRCVTIKSQTAANVPLRLFAIGNKHETMKAKVLKPIELDGITNSFLKGRMSLKPSVKVQSKLRGNMDDLVELTQHPLLDILSNVNPHTEGFGWRESIYADLDIFGRSFHAKVTPRENQPPTSLWRLQPQITRPISSAENFISGFEYGSSNQKQTFEPQDVLWFKTFDPLDPLGGVGPLEAWLKTIDAERKHAAFVDWIYDNGGSPDYVVHAEGGMSVEQKKLFRREWRKMFSRLFNRRENVAILSGNGSITPLGRTPRDLESIEQDNVLRDKIAIAFGVPKSLITTDDVNLANAREGSITFLRNSIMPMVQRVEDVLNEQLTPAWSDRLVLIHENPVLEDRKIILDERESMLKSGYSVDEVREWEGRPTLGTKESQTQMIRTDVMPVDMLKNVFDPVVAVPKQVTDQKRTSETKELAQQPTNDLLPYSQRAIFFGEQELDCDCGEKFFEKEDVKQPFIDDVFDSLRAIDNDVIAALKKLGDKKAADPILNTTQIDAILGEGVDGWVAGVAEASVTNLGIVVAEAGTAAIQSVAVTQPLAEGIVFDLQNTRVVDFLQDESRRIGAAATDTHRSALRNILVKGAQEGNSPAVMAREMRGLMKNGEGIFSKSQAERIARTESGIAQMAGTINGWEQSGVVSGKDFLLAPNACPYCIAVDKMFAGRTLQLRETFFKKGDTLIPDGGGRPMKLDYHDLQSPPIHPNCRCDLVPVIVENIA